MALIALTKGLYTVVDDDLFEELSQYSWYAAGLEGRPARRLRDETRRLIFIYHQVLSVLPWDLRKQGLVVDHIDRNPLNNKKTNLRIVTISENMLNSRRHEFREGFCYDTTNNRYKVYIDQPGQKRINIGTYKTKDEALKALEEARNKWPQ